MVLIMLQKPSPQKSNSGELDEIGFTFKVKIKIGITSLIIAAGLTVIYSHLNEKQREVFNFGAVAFGVCIAGTSTFHAYRSIMHSSRLQEREVRVKKEEKKLDRAIDYIGRWNHPDYAHIKATITEITKGIENQEHTSISDYLKNEPLKTQEVVSILNFLEELSFLVYEGILDKKMIYVFYRGIIVRCYEVLVPFLIYRRNEMSNKKLYEQFEKLYFEWKDISGNGSNSENGIRNDDIHE